jgi:DNA-binding transcriptional LysR family regulator
MEWLKTDLNLLKALHAVLTEGSVSAAARKLHITPSAVSHQLARLRVHTGDPLFTRVGQGMVPTPRALELSRPLSTIVSALAEPEMRGTQSDLASLQREVRIAMPPTLESLLLPSIYSAIEDAAPGLDLVVSPFERRSYGRDLLQGVVDFVFSVGGDYGRVQGVERTLLYADTLATLVGPTSPLYNSPDFDFDLWLDQPHLYSVPWPQEHNYLDQWLARHKRPRRIAVELAHNGSVPYLVRRSRLVATLPAKLARSIAAVWPELRVIAMPIEVAPGEVYLEYATSFMDQPALHAARAFILQAVREELA